VIVESELSEDIQSKIYRPSVEEAGYSVDLDFRKPSKSFSSNGSNGDGEGEIEVEVEV